MRTAKCGDLVQVHFDIRAEDGSVASSRGREPVELTVGRDHPRLPGLGSSLVGLGQGDGVSLSVPPERGHGPHEAGKVRRWPLDRFPDGAALRPGRLARSKSATGRGRVVRVLQVNDGVVVVDGNRRWAGQTIELRVELIGFLPPSQADHARDALVGG